MFLSIVEASSGFLRVSTILSIIVLMLGCDSGSQSSGSLEGPLPSATASSIVDNESVEEDLHEELRGLYRQRQLWRSHNLVDYDFEMSLYVPGTGTPPTPVDVQVRNGKKMSIVPRNDYQRDSPYIDYYDRFETIEGVFTELETTLKNSREVSVLYDMEIGYPKESIVHGLITQPHSGWKLEIAHVEKAGQAENSDQQ